MDGDGDDESTVLLLAYNFDYFDNDGRRDQPTTVVYTCEYHDDGNDVAITKNETTTISTSTSEYRYSRRSSSLSSSSSSSSSHSKMLEKLFVIFLAFVISNLRWFTYAEKSVLFDDSLTKIDSLSSTYEIGNFRRDYLPNNEDDESGIVGDGGGTGADSGFRDPALKRRIRHDTTKDTLNERLIIFVRDVAADIDTDADAETNAAAKSGFVGQRSIELGENKQDRDGGLMLKKRRYRSGNDKIKIETGTRRTTTRTNVKTSNSTRSPPSSSSSPSPSPFLLPFTREYSDSDGCICFEGEKNTLRIAHDLTITLQHDLLNTSQGISVGIVYQVLASSSNKLQNVFIASEDATSGLPIGVFYPSHKNCSHVGQLGSQMSNVSQILLNWSLPSVNANAPVFNVLFRLCYQLAEHNHTVYESLYKFPVIKGCEFVVQSPKGSVSSADLFGAAPSATWSSRTTARTKAEQQQDTSATSSAASSRADAAAASVNCSISFANILNAVRSDLRRRKGLVVKLTRLNVKCGVGYVQFSSNGSVASASASICGKFEEMDEARRQYYFEPKTSASASHEWRIILHGKPTFAFTYELVDFCHNVSLHSRNDSVVISPLLKIFCNYKISLPYGNRINISVSIGWLSPSPSPSPSLSTTATINTDDGGGGGGGGIELQSVASNAPDPYCSYVLVRLWDSNSSKVLCSNDSRPFLNNVTAMQTRWQSIENYLRVRVSTPTDTRLEFSFHYEAEPVADIVGNCVYGSVSANSACISLVDNVKLDWMQAEEHCHRSGGHLASLLDEQSQQIVDQYLIKSPSYHDSNSYWIGASDIGHEGDFRWTDGFVFSYSNWFNGWPLYGYYNRQPNDDGFSSQDCVELRRQYHISPADVDANASKARLTATFTWNDRDCRTKNYFLCESFKLLPNFEDKTIDSSKDCHHNIALNEENERVVVSSPAFPQNYPDNKDCLIVLSTPLLYKIVVVFEEFVLEDEPNCSYDYLEIYENWADVGANTSANSHVPNNNLKNVRRFCGDWSDKLKLLRHVSSGSKLFLHFNSDYSHSFSGFKAYVYIEQVKTDCPDSRLQMFHGSCYLFVSYPQVTWQTAQDICSGLQADLASVHGIDEHHFVISKIRESNEYTTSTIYWLGGKFNVHDADEWKWIDNTSMTFNAWIPMRTNFRQSKINNNDACLGIQWVPSPSAVLPSGLYWVPISCQKVGGYVCKMKHQSVRTDEMNINVTANGTEGELSSPNYPANYYHNLDYWIRITSAENTRIIIQFHSFDLEEQKDCLYDYLEIYYATGVNDKFPPESVRNCGHHHSHQLHRLNFASTSNQVSLHFHSDYSVAGSGFMATWKAVDISSCPIQTLTAREGVIVSPNYPHFLLAHLQCTTTVLAPAGRKVWFEITDWDFDKGRSDETRDKNRVVDSDLHLLLGPNEKLYPYQKAGALTDGVYLSYGEYMKIQLRTDDAPNGRGFRGVYKTVSELHETRVVNLRNDSNGQIYHLNFPLNPVPNLNFVQRFIAPLGYSIHMQFYQVTPSLLDKTKGYTICPNDRQSFIEVHDHYADRNGTWWQFCEADRHQQVSPLAITSYLNSITIKQFSNNSRNGVAMNASLVVVQDKNFKTKISQFTQGYPLESCLPNPCNNNGKCITVQTEKRCECVDHFTGLFCALTICDVNPCVFGACELTKTDFNCVCQQGYQGKLCDKKVKPCSTNPCEGRGECIEKKNFTYSCQCHAWWEGERCEKKIANIPYKPLTDRMLEEPFWLGLLTVFVVLSIIGLVWCARRHFPEKLEKLLAEEAERNRHYVSSGRSSTMRADLMCHNGVATAVNVSQPNTANSSPNPRSLLGRLGIRKPSLFSLTSPLQPTHTARTFSLDDLFKPSSSRSQMSYKHRNSAGYRKKSMDKSLLKKQSCSADDSQFQQNTKIEIIELNEDDVPKRKEKDDKIEETSFTLAKLEKKTDNNKTDIICNKYEKKVHFARLMSKVQAEMIANSDVHVDVDVDVELGVDVDVVGSLNDHQKIDEQSLDKKPLAVPLSTNTTQTCTYQFKSPHSTCSNNRGSDSISSSEMTLITASEEKLNTRRPSLLTLGTSGKCQKAASADSILAMFRKFSFSTAPSSECNSNFVSASTSPTISSPPEEMVGSEDSSLSSYPIPTISSIGSTESLPLPSLPSLPSSSSSSCTKKTYPSAIQVSVLDPLNSNQKTCTNIAASNLLHPPTILLEVPNKCLSPIHEVPTPSPSPSMTPIMPRHHIASSIEVKIHDNECRTPSTDGHTSSLQTSRILVSNSSDAGCSTTNDEKQPPPPPQSQNAKRRELIIPTFTIQEPSPLDEKPAITVCPSSPPSPSPSLSLEYKSNCLQNPPTIMVTGIAEMDSDADCTAGGVGGFANASSVAMTYLSPFSGVCSRGDRTTSESNLCSSGYSSMASPSPSRCSSNNPLCPSESEDQSIGSARCSRRPSPLLATTSSGADKSVSNATALPSDSETLSDDHQVESSNDEGFSTDQPDDGEKTRAREKITADERREKKIRPKDGDGVNVNVGGVKAERADECSPPGTPLKNRSSTNAEQRADHFKKSCSFSTSITSGSHIPNKKMAADARNNKPWLQLPSIVVNADADADADADAGVDADAKTGNVAEADVIAAAATAAAVDETSYGCAYSDVAPKTRSPLSSRSESPLSDRTSSNVNRFSPKFYARFTDSDGIYDCTSSDCLKPVHRKHFGRRREKFRTNNKSGTTSKIAKCNNGSGAAAAGGRCTDADAAAAAAAAAQILLDIPAKTTSADKSWKKRSPKRRIRSQIMKVSASSGSHSSFSSPSSSSSSSSSSSESATSHQSRIFQRKLPNSKLKIKYSSKSSSCATADETSAYEAVPNECLPLAAAATTQLEPIAGGDDDDDHHQHLNVEKNSNADVKVATSQRFNIIEKLSSILSTNDKRIQWKSRRKDSASIPLLIHSHSVEESQTKYVRPSKRHCSKSKHARNYCKSSGLTD